jgi:hypothetical protein
MNPKAPNLRGLIKIPKLGSPIRPIINWQHAPAYRLAKLLSEKLQQELQLPYTFNIKNSQHLMMELQTMDGNNQSFRLTSFDIVNMYTNIRPLSFQTLLKRCASIRTLRQKLKKELFRITKTVLRQNYFKFENNTYTQLEGLAMGAPTSAIFLGLYLQKIEHTDLITILINNNVQGYTGTWMTFFCMRRHTYGHKYSTATVQQCNPQPHIYHRKRN